MSCSLHGQLYSWGEEAGNSEQSRAKLLASNSNIWSRIPTGCALDGDLFPPFRVWVIVLNLWTHPDISKAPAVPLAITKPLFGFSAGQTRGQKNWAAAAATITLTLGSAGTSWEGKYVPLPCGLSSISPRMKCWPRQARPPAARHKREPV